jgi:hypothetical protein
MTLTAISDSLFSCARTINNTMQTVPYAGRAWTLARDNIVLPGAALAVAIWSAGKACISYTADWVLPAIVLSVTTIGIFVVLTLLRRRREKIIDLAPQQPELKKAYDALKAQEKEVVRLLGEWDKARVRDQAVPANKTATAQAEAAHRAADTKRNAMFWEYQTTRRRAGDI